MCYRVVERFNICGCHYYTHDVDMCAACDVKGHGIQEKTVLVGYACDKHTLHDDEKTLFWTDSETRRGHTVLSGGAFKGVKITSAIALSALQEAQWMKDDDESTTAPDISTMDTESTHTTVEDNDRYEAKGEVVKDQTANLNDLRSRLLHPSQYVTSLQTLEETIWNNSCISIYTGWKLDNPASEVKSYGLEDYIPYPVIPAHLRYILPRALSDDPFAIDPTNTSDNEITKICRAAKDHTMSSHLNAIRVCRNIIVKTFLNLKLLQQSNFCAGSFSVINVHWESPHVAMLMPIENTDFIALLFELEYILRDSASTVLNVTTEAAKLDLDRHFMLLGTPTVQQYCQTLLDLDLQYSFDRKLGACLDAFHHGKAVWVFCSPYLRPSLPLYISATIDVFSDIWGPLWKLKDQTYPDKYSAYVVGGGSIVQWKHDPMTCPQMITEQLFCHWISNEELEDSTYDSPEHGHGFTYKPFDGTERLLIGAPSTPSSTPATASREPWSPNLTVRLPLARPERGYKKLGDCVFGVNASATRQYKRVPGQSLKDVLVELWAMEPEIRDPTLLDDLHGVEISICTSNAQRVSLAQILRLKCMHHLLRDFSWQDPEYCAEHFLTLQDTLHPKRLRDPLFKKKFDYAIMLGLKMLSKTGVDRDGNLQVFLSSTCTPKPELASITSKEHTWVGLLRDTTTECAMVAFGDSCLEFKYNDGVSCGTIGHSALRSAIVLHSKEVSIIEIGKYFSLGERGSLRLKAKLGGDMMVMGWSSNSVKMAIKSRLGRDLIHREYTEVDHSEDSGIPQLLPVIVVSDRSRGLV
ncbi:hypothetical protein VTL71DRAFT_14725 [Oculimacula yallundae]|uniref:Uncharacterized protein n=1 Tax=Oculimacula yallundae TaxID=86028 RepID=A0ABR4CJV5_9HELO